MKSKRDEVELAGTGPRFAARLFDGLVLAIISFGAGTVTGGGTESSGVFQIVLSLGYSWYFLTRNEGQTPGKRIMKVRVVRVDGEQLSDGDAIVRELVAWVSAMVFLLGYLWAFADRRNQTWHDKAVDTLVVTADSG